MQDDVVIDNLNSLIHLDIDAVFAYRQAIEKIEEPQIRDELLRFQSEHERHIAVLSAKVRELGGTPPERSRDIKGFLIEGFTALRSVTGTKGALNAMETNEKITNRTYAKYDAMDHPADIRRVITEFHGDEKRHLSYIRQMLKLMEAEHPAERDAAQPAEMQVYHVMAHGADGWWIELEEVVVAKMPTKEEAVGRAHLLAKSGVLCQVVIHDRSGAVESAQTFREGDAGKR